MDESLVTKKELPHRDSVAVMFDHLPLEGASVLDIGCGNGWVARALSAPTERMIGLDPSMAQIGLATKTKSVANEFYVCALGETTPFDDAGFDIVLLFNSFHHISITNQERALDECMRVMKRGGLLYIQEPVASGPAYELCRPLDDEAELYASAFDVIHSVTAKGYFVQVLEEWFNIDYCYDDCESLTEELICVNPDRLRRLDQLKTSLDSDFYRLGRKESDGWHFAQVQRVNLLKKP
jgi:SAM-dependent methyltransferase